MAEANVPSLEWLRNRLEETDPDLLRAMVETVVATLMGSEADALCGATYGARQRERTNRRNGYPERAWDSRLGAIPLQIPKLRQGSYFPDWLLEPRRRAEKAIVQVVAEASLRGVSVRRIESLVQTLGIDRLSKSRVAEMAKELDELVQPSAPDRSTAGLTPTSGSTPDPALPRRRASGQRRHRHRNRRQYRRLSRSPGCDVITSEDGAGWTARSGEDPDRACVISWLGA
jgi:putative transposase